MPLQMVLGFGIAFLINAEWRGRGVVRALFLIPMVVAPVIAGGVWRMLLDPLWGLVNYALAFFSMGPVDWLGDPTYAMATVVIIDTTTSRHAGQKRTPAMGRTLSTGCSSLS